MHVELAAEAKRKLGGDEALDRAPAGTARQARCHEQGLPRGRDADPLELGGGGDERRLPGVASCARDRQGGWLDEDRRATAARYERLERLPGEREAERVADRCPDVRDRLLRGRGRGDDHGVLTGVDDQEPRAVEERNAPHVRAPRT